MTSLNASIDSTSESAENPPRSNLSQWHTSHHKHWVTLTDWRPDIVDNWPSQSSYFTVTLTNCSHTIFFIYSSFYFVIHFPLSIMRDKSSQVQVMLKVKLLTGSFRANNKVLPTKKITYSMSISIIPCMCSVAVESCELCFIPKVSLHDAGSSWAVFKATLSISHQCSWVGEESGYIPRAISTYASWHFLSSGILSPTCVTAVSKTRVWNSCVVCHDEETTCNSTHQTPQYLFCLSVCYNHAQKTPISPSSNPDTHKFKSSSTSNESSSIVCVILNSWLVNKM